MKTVQRDLIKSIGYSEREIIANIMSLYLPNKGCFHLDPTYSTGNFYKGLTPPKLKFDAIPQIRGVKKSDCRDLPIGDETIESIMFDPPFLASSSNKSPGEMRTRFGWYKDYYDDLWPMYYSALEEFYRILIKKGIVVFKCQDQSSGNFQYFTHCEIINMASDLGYAVVDLFILLAKNRLVAPMQTRAYQKSARKYHCYFIVLQKKDTPVKYAIASRYKKKKSKNPELVQCFNKRRIFKRRTRCIEKL